MIYNEPRTCARGVSSRRTFVRPPIAQLAEAVDLKSIQCRFESDWGDNNASWVFPGRELMMRF